VKVLLDECVPRRFAVALAKVDVSTARREGWTSLRNGELLSRMRTAGFSTLVTVDRNLTYQQNVAAVGIAVIVVHARTNRVTDLLPLASHVMEAIARTAPGEIAHVGV
jgi:hypothetical protein